VAIHIKPLRGLAEILFPLFTPYLFLKKRRAIRIIFFLLFPLSNSVREGELKGVSKKREGAIGKSFYSIVPLSNSFREGELKGVSKNTSLTQFKM
jgi:hypothetical protein